MDEERLQRLLGRPELARLVAALRRRLEAGERAGSVTLTAITDAERRAVEGLLGRPARAGRSLRVDLAEIEALLRRAGIAADLTLALERLGGPLRDRRGEREALARAWEQTFQEARAGAPAALGPWLDQLARGGLLKRLAADPADGRRLLGELFALLERLPARGLALSTLAADVAGDAHALDRGRPLGTLARACLAFLDRARRQAPGEEPEAEEETERQEGERAIWAAFGVRVGGDITSTALVLNLPALAEGPTGRVLAAWGEQGEPGYLTLRQLLRAPPAWACRDRPVFICENPAVVAEAAERLGPRCAPLICTQGRPRAAVLILLDTLAAAGARLHYHGDFDWPGIAIANGLFRRLPLTPWHFDATALHAAEPLPGRPLTGAPVVALWDDALAPTLRARGRALHEEQQIGLLLRGLAERG